jgi:hypothetical protein
MVFCFYLPYLKVLKILCGVNCSASEKYMFRHPTAPVAPDTPSFTSFNDNLWSYRDHEHLRYVVCVCVGGGGGETWFVGFLRNMKDLIETVWSFKRMAL